jgi:hypothetical protein
VFTSDLLDVGLTLNDYLVEDSGVHMPLSTSWKVYAWSPDTNPRQPRLDICSSSQADEIIQVMKQREEAFLRSDEDEPDEEPLKPLPPSSQPWWDMDRYHQHRQLDAAVAATASSQEDDGDFVMRDYNDDEEMVL